MPNATVSTYWTPPPPERLVYNNCTAAAPWLARYSSMYENGDLSWNGVSLEIAIGFLRSMVPENWTQPTDADLLTWYEKRSGGLEPGGVTMVAMLNFTLSDCGEELCHRLQWQGDPDLAGVGAVISYYILAFFATIYFLVLVVDTFLRTRQKTAHRNPHNSLVFFISGFKKSLTTFQDAVLLFAISINVAAVTRWLAPIVHPSRSHAYYGLINSVVMSSFSVFPAVALQSLLPGVHHRRGIRLCLWALTIIFVVVVEVLYRYVYLGDYFLEFWGNKVQFNEDIWLENCDSIPLRITQGYLTMAGHIFLTVNCLWWLYHATSGPRRGGRARRVKDKLVSPERRAPWRELWERWQEPLRLANGLAALVFMWLFLIIWIVYREDVRNRAGSADEDSQWTFGQVLSLTTWAPVGVELVTVYIYESKEDGHGKSHDACRGDELPSTPYFESHLYSKKMFEETLETITLDDDVSFRRLDEGPRSPLPSTYSRLRTHDFV